MASSRKTGTNESISTFGDVTRDYQVSELTVWEQATDTDLVNVTHASPVLECYDDAASFDDRVAVAGATTDATYFRIIRPADGEGHDGTPNNGVTFISTTDANGFDLNENYSQIQDIIATLNINSVTGRMTFRATTDYNYFIGCMAVNSNNAGTGVAWGIIMGTGADYSGVINCLCHNNESQGISFNLTTGTHQYGYNNTSIDNHNGGGIRVGSTSGTIHLKNCLASGNTGGDFKDDGSTATKDIDYCASADSTADDWGGAGNRISQTFTFVNSGGDDYHLASTDAGARDYGTDLSATFDDDIDKSTRGNSPWDIGFDEFFKQISVSNTTTVTDSVSIYITQLFISVSDTTTVTDFVGYNPDQVDLLENVIISITGGGISDLSVSVADTTAITDSASSFIPAYLFSAIDTSSITDSVSVYETSYKISVSDTTVVTDSVSVRIPTLYPSVSDTTNISDSTAVLITYKTVNVSDTITVTDSAAIAISSPKINVADTTNVTDSITTAGTAYLSVSETSNITDAVNLSLSALENDTFSVADTSAVTDAVSLYETSYKISVADTSTITDSVSMAGTKYLSVADTTVITDSDSLGLFPKQISVSDTTAVTDLATVNRGASAIMLAETSAVTDAVSIYITQLFISVSDTTNITDGRTVSVSSPLISISDTSSITDSRTLTISNPQISVADTTSVSDTPTVVRVDYIAPNLVFVPTYSQGLKIIG